MSMNFLDAAGVLADSAELLADDMMAREAKSIWRLCKWQRPEVAA